ncbi:MAG: pyridoxamine 5'-phosphate oxidase family protein [bacterium]|nr:pyridoxamine 5'-phosphate oxidase family protein [bacterium]
MAYGFLDVFGTPGVRAAQTANGVRERWAAFDGDRAFDRLTENEAAFIAERDSFYLASVSESGWPYVQHRGGPLGFLKVLDDTTLAFADFAGNRQYISLGNVATDDRVSLILVDYPRRARLKILAHVEVRDLATDLDLAERLALPGYRARIERAFVLRLETFDWNCPQHITPRFTTAEIEAGVAPLRDRITSLEAENLALRRRLGEA